MGKFVHQFEGTREIMHSVTTKIMISLTLNNLNFFRRVLDSRLKQAQTVNQIFDRVPFRGSQFAGYSLKSQALSQNTFSTFDLTDFH